MKHLSRPRLALALSGLLGCQSMAGAGAPSDAEILARWMTGSFSSEAQSIESPGDYFDIRLFMVPIWSESEDGHWLYVEQAAGSALERPYRQRVYHLVDTPEGPRSDVYELPGDPLAFAGAWRSPESFNSVSPSELSLREGCSIFLCAEAGSYRGSTRGEGCSSSLGGAAYATSEVSISPNMVTSWDRGFDAAGAQAWGAEMGPYLFVRQAAR